MGVPMMQSFCPDVGGCKKAIVLGVLIASHRLATFCSALQCCISCWDPAEMLSLILKSQRVSLSRSLSLSLSLSLSVSLPVVVSFVSLHVVQMHPAC